MDATASGGGDPNGIGRDGGEKKDATAAAATAKKVSLLGMFRYADRLDVLLMVVGAVGAVANGVAEPLMTVIFGNVIDSFGDSTAPSVIRSVSKVCAHKPAAARGRASASPSDPLVAVAPLDEQPILTVGLLPPGCSLVHIFGHRSSCCLLPS